MRQLIKSLNIKIYDFVQTKWLRQNIQKKYLAISMIPFEKNQRTPYDDCSSNKFWSK